MSILDVLRNALARTIAAREELACGTTTTAEMILHDLEIDLVAALYREGLEEQA